MTPRKVASRPTTTDGRSYLKMKELSTAVQLPKSTILHYANEGLLLESIKTETNMAYYHPDCVERIDLIKRLQTRFRLPLAKIRRLLQKHAFGMDIMALAEYQETVFGPEDRPRLDLDAFCLATGLSTSEVVQEMQAGVLTPLEEGQFDADDVAIGRLRKEARQWGILPEDVTYYSRLAEKLVDCEMALRDRVVADLAPQEDVVVTMKMTQSTQGMRTYAFNRAFQRRIIQFQNQHKAKIDKS